MALFAATGLLVRTTTDDLYKRVFTVRNPAAGIRAAFFVTKDGRKRGGQPVAPGTALHVAGLLDSGVVLNSAEGGARVRPLADIAAWFERDGCALEVRGLERIALERIALEGKTVSGLDKEFGFYFGGAA
jgi:murein DD-endopeptidase